MKVFEINAVPYGSTGRLMFQIAEEVEKSGGSAWTSASYTKPRGIIFPKKFIQIGTAFGKAFHIAVGRITGWHGFCSWIATYRLVRKIREIDPDVIHLHNLHGWYLNYPIFSKYLKTCRKPIVWTLHDCWALTGICPHYTMAGCDKWKIQCNKCLQFRDYPGGFIDRSKALHSLKRNWFSGIPNLTLVVPSVWLKSQVEDSYLRNYPIKVINNWVDLKTFYPSESNFRRKYGLDEKIILLGVAFEWTEQKGVSDFFYLAENLPNSYQVVLVGKSKQLIPPQILWIKETSNQKELAEIYTAADVFVNPTHEEVFGLVNIEALACGTPVVTYNTGGSPECIDEICGVVVEEGNKKQLLNTLIKLREISGNSCIKRAINFSKREKIRDYLKLYSDICYL